MPNTSSKAVPQQSFNMSETLKRLEDITLGILILLIVSIPMMLIALLIKMTSPGPIFFRQRRYGRNGQVITVYKFRTMYVLEKDFAVTQVEQDDPRVTMVGRFLRRTSLDELPQFFNVIKGDMSIVGPRPHSVMLNLRYRKLLPGYMCRYEVKPGITGWAQVNGHRGQTPFLETMEARLEYDLWYIDNWTLQLDLLLIIISIFKIFYDKNAC